MKSTTTTQQQRTRQLLPAEAKRERSIALADERRELSGGMNAVHFLEAECDPWSGELVRLTVEVDSAHHDWERYRVVYEAGDDLAFCTCLAAQNCAPCWHAGQATLYGRHAADAYSPAACAATRREQSLAQG